MRTTLASFLLLIASACAPLCAQQQNPVSPAKDEQPAAQIHQGVLVGGHSEGGTESVFIDVLDILGERGVRVANDVDRIGDIHTTSFMSLPALLKLLPKIGADSLLYIKVEHGMTSRAATVYFECFDVTGHMLWQEKANDVLLNGGNTILHRTGWKKKLNPHIGGPGLELKK